MQTSGDAKICQGARRLRGRDPVAGHGACIETPPVTLNDHIFGYIAK